MLDMAPKEGFRPKTFTLDSTLRALKLGAELGLHVKLHREQVRLLVEYLNNATTTEGK